MTDTLMNPTTPGQGFRTFPRRICRLAALTVASLALGGGCATQKPAPQPVTSAEVPAQSFYSKWSADLKLPTGDVATQVFLREEFVIIYTRSHKAYVLDKDQGAIRFEAQATKEFTTLRPPVVLKDWVVFPTTTNMEIYNRQGTKLREVATGGVPLRSNVVGSGTHIYFGGDSVGGGRIVNEDLAGSQYQAATIRWELLTRGGVSAAPVFHQGLVYGGDERGGVYAVNADSRAPVWALKEEGMEENVFKTRGPIRADLKADDYGVYVASTDTKLYCIERTTGHIRWQYFAGVPLYYSPTVTPTLIYLHTDEQGIAAIDKANGEYNRRPRWTAANAIKFLSEDEKHVYLERNDHAIMAVDKATGQTLFASKRTDFVSYTTNLGKDPKTSNVIYGTTTSGQVRAIVPALKAGQRGELVMTAEPVDAMAMGK